MWKQSRQCKGYSHIYTHQQQVVKYWKPNSSLHILTTSWNYVSLTTWHKKTLSHEWDKQTPSKKKKNSSSPCLHHQTRLIWPPTNALQASMSAFQLHTHTQRCDLPLAHHSQTRCQWCQREPTDIADAPESRNASHGARERAALPKWQKHAVELLISHWRSKVMQHMNKCVIHEHIRDQQGKIHMHRTAALTC